MPQIIDTKSGKAVGPCGHQTVQALVQGVTIAWIDRVFADIEAFFSGRHPVYLAIGRRYHPLAPTLLATARPVELLASRHRAEIEPLASCRQLELPKFLRDPDSTLISAASSIFWPSPSRVGSTLTSPPPKKTVR